MTGPSQAELPKQLVGGKLAAAYPKNLPVAKRRASRKKRSAATLAWAGEPP